MNSFEGRDSYRGKAAAWTAAAIGMIGISAAEVTVVEPAKAGIEHSGSLEAKDARTYISELDKKLISVTNAIKSSDDVQYFKGPPTKTRPEAQKSTDYYIVAVPNVTNPKHQDLLGITTAKNLKIPISMNMYIDSYKKNGISVSKQEYSIYHDDVDLNYSQNEVRMFRKSGKWSEYFRVGTQKTPRSIEVEYQDDPQAVTTQFTQFFKYASSILKRAG